ncbi:AzlC family ABC transporter permease [Campylobacter helveticus]|uniref:AzlC family ABC transporter permease n=1 Tax=Campylobacter helveticus TaxID=28898 RepID=A0ABY3L341_9BACT|nr:AzlC family ABC transporter permease [Campylobacter helveticus]ARE80539.1 branched-chain amino acid transport protein, AzlC family [Campylobacter helveticus]MCR2039314.1 AzlC family ABC transporter permease [Campylobacter helveticus]MCR2055294.1 AzlC family ABC transporter permease [Campylobacter helveticus]MCR2062800.1 AzlC family ABC transporter permease [Campylobacter helveticus]QBL11351.1 branched-chain amino acid ABC transporter permease [Campylobacter helveticus]
MKNLFSLTLPVLMGYIPLGMAFGILATSEGFSFYQVLLSSLVVYAGAGQFVLVALISGGAGFLEVALTSFLVNFRHFFYTLSLLKEFKKMNFLRHYAIFALTDESFALISSRKNQAKNLSQKEHTRLIFGICFLNHSYWILGSLLGFLFQKNIKIDYSGIEFSLNALFIVLAYELYKQNPKLKILLFATLLSLLALFCIDKAYMFAFCLSVGLALLFLGKRYV